MTTFQTLTVEQIKALRNEARAAGDTAQVELCGRALQGDATAKAKCVEAIRYAEAMQ